MWMLLCWDVIYISWCHKREKNLWTEFTLDELSVRVCDSVYQCFNKISKITSKMIDLAHSSRSSKPWPHIWMALMKAPCHMQLWMGGWSHTRIGSRDTKSKRSQDPWVPSNDKTSVFLKILVRILSSQHLCSGDQAPDVKLSKPNHAQTIVLNVLSLTVSRAPFLMLLQNACSWVLCREERFCLTQFWRLKVQDEVIPSVWPLMEADLACGIIMQVCMRRSQRAGDGQSWLF